MKITALYIDIKGIHIKTCIYEGTCCSNCVCNDDFPLDIRRRLNVHNILRTFYVRSIYIFHTGDHFLIYTKERHLKLRNLKPNISKFITKISDAQK